MDSAVICGYESWDVVPGLSRTKDFMCKLSTRISSFLTTPAAVLLSGDPGAGKGIILRAFARHLYDQSGGKITLFDVDVTLFDGHPSRWETLRKMAEEMAPAIIWINEIDSMLHATRTQSFSFFKDKLLPDANVKSGVIIMAATNHPEKLENGARSRFTTHTIEQLDGSALRTLLERHGCKITEDQFMEIEPLLSNKSARDIQQIAASALLDSPDDSFTFEQLRKVLDSNECDRGGDTTARIPDVFNDGIISEFNRFYDEHYIDGNDRDETKKPIIKYKELWKDLADNEKYAILNTIFPDFGTLFTPHSDEITWPTPNSNLGIAAVKKTTELLLKSKVPTDLAHVSIQAPTTGRIEKWYNGTKVCGPHIAGIRRRTNEDDESWSYHVIAQEYKNRAKTIEFLQGEQEGAKRRMEEMKAAQNGETSTHKYRKRAIEATKEAGNTSAGDAALNEDLAQID